MKVKCCIVIVGGGIVGWMVVVVLLVMLFRQGFLINFVELEQIGIIGVGEVMLFYLCYFNDIIGIQEVEFVQVMFVIMKFGIEFVNWGDIGDCYIYLFGMFGYVIQGVKFY